jgi:hypothetical protein
MPPPTFRSGHGMASADGSWDEYRLHVIQSLKRIDDGLEKLWLAISDVKRDVTALKIKVAVWICGGVDSHYCGCATAMERNHGTIIRRWGKL